MKNVGHIRQTHSSSTILFTPRSPRNTPSICWEVIFKGMNILWNNYRYYLLSIDHTAGIILSIFRDNKTAKREWINCPFYIKASRLWLRVGWEKALCSLRHSWEAILKSFPLQGLLPSNKPHSAPPHVFLFHSKVLPPQGGKGCHPWTFAVHEVSKLSCAHFLIFYVGEVL